jgi:DNA-binding NarL/FixJ family response regulator
MITVLLSESSRIGCQLLKEGIKEHLQQFEVIACATSIASTIEAARQNNPDLILLNSNLEDGPSSGVRVLHQLREMQLCSRVIVLLDIPDRELVIAAFRGGARGIFVHEQPISMLCKCMQRVYEGQIWADSRQLQYLLGAFAGMPQLLVNGNSDTLLTTREAQIANLVAEGLSNRDISRRLYLSEHTVKNYLFRIFEKLGISNRVDLAMYMVQRKKSEAA